MTSDAKSPGAVIGENLRALREERGKRQDDVAAAARECGLKWSQATVGAIETGRREVSVGELMLLPAVMFKCVDVNLTVSDFLGTKGDVVLGPDAIGTPMYLAAAFSGGVAQLPPRALHVPWTRKAAKTMRAVVDVLRSPEFAARLEHTGELIERILGPKARMADAAAAEIDAGQLVERRAAGALDVEPMAVALAARKLWGHGLTAERDKRTRAAGIEKARAAGPITRQLMAELRPVLDAAGITATNQEE